MNVPIDISSVVLHTPRLTLRPFCAEDLDDFFAYARVDGVGQMAGWAPHKHIDESRSILRQFIEGRITFAIVLGGRVIGSIGVEAYDEDAFPELAALACRELGFALARDCWGRGLMPEAVQAVLTWLFQAQKLDAVVCGHFPENTQSARVQEKLGFHPIKTYLYTTRMGTKIQAVYSVLTRADFLHTQP